MNKLTGWAKVGGFVAWAHEGDEGIDDHHFSFAD
jgi:hypothetical protein